MTYQYFDDANQTPYPNQPGLNAKMSVIQNGAAVAAVTYAGTNDLGLGSHLTSGSNLAGYLSWGTHSSLACCYTTNNEVVWTSGGSNSWHLIETIESYNGLRYETGYGNFIQWFSAGAFGGTSYANTPIGAVSYTDEPGVSGVNGPSYFGLWQAGLNFGICAWNSVLTTNFQAVGDPLVVR